MCENNSYWGHNIDNSWRRGTLNWLLKKWFEITIIIPARLHLVEDNILEKKENLNQDITTQETNL